MVSGGAEPETDAAVRLNGRFRIAEPIVGLSEGLEAVYQPCARGPWLQPEVDPSKLSGLARL
jgi:hypothetical protein